jgi:hypothetical protein
MGRMLGRHALAFVCVTAVAGCGDNSENVARVDLALGQATFIRYREGDGPWRHPDLLTDGSYLVRGGYEFELVAVKVVPGVEIFAEQLAATYAEADHWVDVGPFIPVVGDQLSPAASFDDPCFSFHVGPTVTVTGQMAQAGDVDMDRSCASRATAPWSFALQVSPGTHDLIAAGGGAMAIRRELQIDAATTLPDLDLDLAAEGAALVSHPILITNPDPSGYVYGEVDLYTQHDGLAVSSAEGTVAPGRTIDALAVPPSLLVPSDVQTVEVYSPGGDAPMQRAARAAFTDRLPELDLLAPPSAQIDVVSDVDVISWQGPLAPRWTYLDFEVDSGSFPTSFTQRITATRKWLEAHDATSLQFDVDVPEYDRSWSVDRAHVWSRTIDVRDDATPVAYQTTVHL